MGQLLKSGGLLLFVITLGTINAFPTPSDPNCNKTGYFYSGDSTYQLEEPDCTRGTWVLCRNCHNLGQSVVENCTRTKDTVCGPKLDHVTGSNQPQTLSKRTPVPAVNTTIPGHTDDAKDQEQEDQRPFKWLPLIIIFAISFVIAASYLAHKCSTSAHDCTGTWHHCMDTVLPKYGKFLRRA